MPSAKKCMTLLLGPRPLPHLLGCIIQGCHPQNPTQNPNLLTSASTNLLMDVECLQVQAT
jgi:hypothetical protein